MESRLCYGCHKYVPESGFAPSTWQRKKGLCRECQADYNTRNYDKQAKWINELKSVPCMDCGISYPPCVMDFDHREPEEKFKRVSRLYGYSHARIQAEVAKCDVVCSNCHRLRTQQDKGLTRPR